jgi:hypothetical protein
MYKLIREDYKNDRALLHYASVQEMMALCVHLMEPLARSKEGLSIFGNCTLQLHTCRRRR